jgi:hydroxyacylglutathione hydrolase
MKIHQYYTYNDLRNFTYVIELDSGEAIVLDPWDADETSGYLADLGLTLRTIINTHEHGDHTRGNAALVAEHQCQVWAHENGQDKIPGMTRALTAGEDIELRIRGEDDRAGYPGAHLRASVLFGSDRW